VADVSQAIAANLRRGSDPALEFKHQWMSWGELAAVAGAVADALSQIPGDALIGVAPRNRPFHAATLLGLLAARRSISILHAFLPPVTLAKDVASRKLAAVIADIEDWSPELLAEAQGSGTLGLALTGDLKQPVKLVAGGTLRSDATRTAEPVFELITSGTTGLPKRMPFKFPVIEHAIMSVVPGRKPEGEPPPQINMWPFGHVGGLCNLFAFGVQGNRMTLLEKFTPPDWADAVRRYKPAVATLNPAAIRMVLDANIPVEDLESVKWVFGGAARLDPEIQEEFEKRYGLTVVWGYGATEFAGSACSWTPDLKEKYGDAKRGSVGPALPGVEIRIVDPATGARLGPNEEGVLEARIKVIGPDWIHTTDLGVIDEDGFLFLRGRNDGAIVRGGFKILPEKVAECLRRHESVADAAIIGIDDARLGQVPVGLVELRPGAPRPTEAALLDHIRAHLPATHVPVELRIVDALPRTQSFKPAMGEIRKIFGVTK
jgi:long-chain acyl-CoA synthetase